ncbi:MAG: transposase [Noviherbaspirillum sp.]
MARLPRYFVKGVPLHIILRGNNREPIFGNDEDCQFFKDALLDAAKRHELAIHAYVFMTNHIHILASPGTEDSVPKTMQSLGRRYVQYFNFRYKRSGTLWEGRYRATVVDAENYLFECMRYIELNPVRAGMVGHPRDYAWSSHQANGEGRADDLVTPHSLYRRLAKEEGERLANYRALFKTPNGYANARRDSRLYEQGLGAGWRTVSGEDRTADGAPNHAVAQGQADEA